MSEEMTQIRCPRTPNEYTIKDSEHIKELPESSLERIGNLLNDRVANGTPSWLMVACALNIEKEDIAEIWTSQYPGFEVLMKWRKKSYSTIKVLRQVMRSINRLDVIPLLEECQLDLIHLTIRLNYKGVEVQNLSGKCPSRMPIIEYVHPQISRKMTPEFVSRHHAQRVIIQLRRSDVTWTSPAKVFQGQRLTLEKVILDERHYSERQRRRELLSGPVCTNGCVISERDDICICFEVVNDNDFDSERE
jgi:hypothetical protein